MKNSSAYWAFSTALVGGKSNNGMSSDVSGARVGKYSDDKVGSIRWGILNL